MSDEMVKRTAWDCIEASGAANLDRARAENRIALVTVLDLAPPGCGGLGDLFASLWLSPAEHPEFVARGPEVGYHCRCWSNEFDAMPPGAIIPRYWVRVVGGRSW